MSSKTKSQTWIVRIGRAHARLWISITIGILTYTALQIAFADWHVTTRLLVGWNVTVLVYLVKAGWMMARSPVADIRRHASGQDEGAFVLLILTVAAALASLGAIFVQFGNVDAKAAGYGFYAMHAIATVILSWAFIHTIFALHYAYEFYGEDKHAGGLKFPGDDKPDYWDFVYFSFVIGMTFQVSDVAVTNKWIRRIVVCHGALSFFFTTAIIALTVNIAGAAFSR